MKTEEFKILETTNLCKNDELKRIIPKLKFVDNNGEKFVICR